MVIEPSKPPDKVPPPKEQQGPPSYQQQPQKDFDKQVGGRGGRYPPDKEVVKELKHRTEARPDVSGAGKQQPGPSQQPPAAQPKTPPPRQQAQQEGAGSPGFGSALEEGLESMQQQPAEPQTGSGQQTPLKDKPKEKIKTKDEAQKAPPPKDQKKEAKQTQPQQPQAPQQPQVQAPQAGAVPQAGVQVPGQVMGAGTGTNIDQVINVFQNNPVFQSHVQTLTLTPRGADTEISVLMANGVNVSVTVMAGGKDLNVTIRGITAEAQAAMDNPANQALLQAKLGEKGFVIHQMRTFRGEEPAKPTGEAARRESEQTGGQGGTGDEETK